MSLPEPNDCRSPKVIHHNVTYKIPHALEELVESPQFQHFDGVIYSDGPMDQDIGKIIDDHPKTVNEEKILKLATDLQKLRKAGKMLKLIRAKRKKAKIKTWDEFF